MSAYHSQTGTAPTASACLTVAPLCQDLGCTELLTSPEKSVQCEEEVSHSCIRMQNDAKLCTNTSSMLLSDFGRWSAISEEEGQMEVWNLDAVQIASWCSPSVIEPAI